MLYSFLLYLGYTAITIAALAIITVFTLELLSYLTYLKRYKPQGLNYHYYPILGIGHYIKKCQTTTKDSFDGFNNYFKKCQDPIHLSNVLFRTSPFVNLTDAGLINEFFMQDTDVSKRFSFDDKFMIADSFLFKRGHRAMHLRSVMLEVFKSGNMEKLAPMINEKTFKVIEKIKEKELKGKEGFQEVLLNSYMNELFSEMICMILFGVVTDELRKSR